MLASVLIVLVATWLLLRGAMLGLNVAGAAERWKGTKRQRLRGTRPTMLQARLAGAGLVAGGVALAGFLAAGG
jgi:hypothetical protein